ncbi:PREDICTED: pectinesterase QRT1 [Tarenaya hassleriana]|uniref:pectinesterase QRT1 n=1 Tax=Tarenaya hassleriana TaxID=28532 RepID=UPI00053CA075|nr:PREDICTED: pectinesterase QRT1 [Tarenaya hassleriana]
MKGHVFIAMFVVFVGLGTSLTQREGNWRDYMSWDDMKLEVDEVGGARPSFRDNGMNQSRVIVVDKNGFGDSVTVQGAVDMVPENNLQRVKIFILPGFYREKVMVPRNKPYISFIGNESRVEETVISWDDKASDIDENGLLLGTYRSASVTVESDFFCATAITFQNTVVAEPGGYGMQAVALRISGDRAMFYRVRVLGTQDTLLDESGSHYFFQSHIQGSVDFIFGKARSLYQDCVIQSTAKRSGAIAAHHRDSEDEDTGFSFVDCVINGTGKIYLGRAWGNYSRAIYSNCYIADVITPMGWSDWNFPYRQRTVLFGEYNCRGRGAERGGRVPWSKNLTFDEVRPFLDIKFIYGEQWLRL